MLLAAFNRAEEVNFVFDDRSPQRRAELLRTVRQRAKVVLLCKLVVAQKVEGVSVKIVRAGFRDDIDDTRGRSTEFGGVGVGHNLELLNRLLGNGGTGWLRN